MAGAAMTHEPTGKPGGPGLWKHKGWQLPAYIQHVFNDLVQGGKPKAEATYRLAVGIVQNWAEGHDGKGGKVSAETKAKAAKAIAEWEAMRAATKAGKSGKLREASAALGTPPTVTDDDLRDMAVLAQGRLELLERRELPTTGERALFDRALVEAAGAGIRAQRELRQRGHAQATDPNFESKHARGPGGKWIAMGSSGREVRAVQRRVGARVDGQFGTGTASAVRAFQKKHGLVVDGVVGRQTVAALRGRKDAKRVKVGQLTTGDRTFLAGHVKGSGGKRRTHFLGSP